MINISDYYAAAEKSVLSAGEILKKYYLKNFRVEYKSARNPVTAADKNSEKAIIKILKKKFPGVKFLCEESCSNAVRSGRGLVWILDPMDGTVNFVHRLPFFSVSLALYDGDKPLLGIVYNPLNKEFFHAVKNKGAYLNGRKINVSKTRKIGHSLIVTGFPYDYPGRHKRVAENLDNFYKKAEGLRRFGSAAIDLCYVARGYFDGFWEEGLNSWDVAAGALIVKESGGKTTDFSGGNNYLFGQTLVASNSKIHNQMIKITGGRK